MRRALDQAATESIVDDDQPAAHSLHETRHTEQRIPAEFERVTETVVQAPQNNIHGFQTAQRFQIHSPIQNRQIRAFDKCETPLARKE
jgi:hypothetical protein